MCFLFNGIHSNVLCVPWTSCSMSLTSSSAVGDGKHLPSKLLLLYFFDELSSLSDETLNTSVLPVSHTHLPSVREEHQAVGDLERDPPPPVWRACSKRHETRELRVCPLVCELPEIPNYSVQHNKRWTCVNSVSVSGLSTLRRPTFILFCILFLLSWWAKWSKDTEMVTAQNGSFTLEGH